MKNYKRSFALLGILFLLWHALATLCYTLPQNLVPSSLRKYSTRYMEPLFNQGWALFAPIPQCNKQVFVSYEINGKWSEWKDPFQEYLVNYQADRVSGTARIALSVSGALHYLQQANLGKFRNGLLPADISQGQYRVVEHLVKMQLRNSGIKTAHIRMMACFSLIDGSNKQCIYH